MQPREATASFGRSAEDAVMHPVNRPSAMAAMVAGFIRIPPSFRVRDLYGLRFDNRRAGRPPPRQIRADSLEMTGRGGSGWGGGSRRVLSLCPKPVARNARGRIVAHSARSVSGPTALPSGRRGGSGEPPREIRQAKTRSRTHERRSMCKVQKGGQKAPIRAQFRPKSEKKSKKAPDSALPILTFRPPNRPGASARPDSASKTAQNPPKFPQNRPPTYRPRSMCVRAERSTSRERPSERPAPGRQPETFPPETGGKSIEWGAGLRYNRRSMDGKPTGAA